MAITINGTGTITGISAGGLPDGSVTAADIESSLDLTGKTVTLPSGTGGKIIKSAVLKNSTRATLTSTGSNTNRVTMLSWSYDKISSSSDLIFFGTIVGKSTAASGYISPCCAYGSTELIGGWWYQYGNHGYSALLPVGGAITGHTTTGSQTFAVQYFSANSTSGQKPVVLINPNSSDDGRMVQTESVITILEVVS